MLLIRVEIFVLLGWQLLADVSGQPFSCILKGQTRPLVVRPRDCPEISVNNYKYALRNMPEEQKIHFRGCRSLKSHLIRLFSK